MNTDIEIKRIKDQIILNLYGRTYTDFGLIGSKPINYRFELSLENFKQIAKYIQETVNKMDKEKKKERAQYLKIEKEMKKHAQ